jgi:phospholipid/cholesterol/gamma-HCH transport system substrate-binding protein
VPGQQAADPVRRRRVFLNLVFFTVLSAVMVGWAIANVVTIRPIERPYTLRGTFAATGGVGANAEVTYLGVPIGTVAGVERVTGGVLVSMDIDRGVDIPMGSSANIQRKSAIGEPIVDFRPPPDLSGPGAAMPKGSKDFVIPMEQTTIPLEFSELLRSASRLISSIPPDAVSTLLREAAIGLQGNADNLRTLGDAADELGTTLASRTATLNRLSSNNTALTKLLADKSGTITTTLHDLDLLAQTLRAGRADTNRLLDQAPPSFAEASSLVEAIRPSLDCSLDVLGQVIDIATTDQKLRELHALLTIGPRAFAGIYDSYDIEPDGPWIRVGLVASSSSPPPQFAPPKVLPASNPPKVCATSVAATPSGVNYTPAAGAGSAGGPLGMLPATGRESSLAAVGLLAAAGLAARLLARRPLRRRRA